MELLQDNEEKNAKNTKNVTQMNDYMLSYIEEWLYYHKINSENTYVNYRSDIKKISQELFGIEYKYITRKTFEEVMTIENLRIYFKAMREDSDYSHSTINRRKSSLKSLLERLILTKIINFPLEELRLIPTLKDERVEIAIPSAKVTDEYVEYFGTLSSGEIIQKAAMFSIDTGLRATDTLNLEWHQFYPEDNYVLVKSKGKNRAKNNKSWVHKISYEFYEMLLDLKTDDSKRVFNISYSTLAKAMQKATIDLGYEDMNYSFHSFRKRSITYAHKLTGNIRSAQQKAGHSRLDTTQRYVEAEEYSITGYYSLKGNVEPDLYKRANNEDLITAIEALGRDTIHLLNLKLSELRNKTE